MIDSIKIGMKIAESRKLINISQEDLANKLFISRQLISKWENGLGIPSIDIIIELSKLFNISIEELLCLEDSIDVDEKDLFHNHERGFIVKAILEKKIDVDLPSVFHQFLPNERMLILGAIRNGDLKCDIERLQKELSLGEQGFLKLKSLIIIKED